MGNNQARSNSRRLALTAVMAALYAVTVLVFAPISFQVIQVRIADVLLPLSMLLGPAAVAGLALGAFVGNLVGPNLGPVDIVGGTLANLIATALALYISRRGFRGRWVVGIVAEILTITFVVGTYLSPLTATPLVLSWAYVMLGEAVSAGIGGYLLITALARILGPSLQKWI